MDNLNCLGKSKKQLIDEFRQFYYKKAAPMLPEYEVSRNKDKLNVYSINLLLLGFIFVLVGFVALKLIGAIFIVLAVVIIVLKNGSGKTMNVEMDYENKLKNILMPEFLTLFGNFRWYKSSYLGRGPAEMKRFETISKANKQIYKVLSSLKITPFFHLFSLDDVIEGSYHNVGIKLLETKLGLKAVNILTSFVFAMILAFVVPFYFIIGGLIVGVVASIFSIFSNDVAIIFSIITVLLLILFPAGLIGLYFIITGSMRCLVVELDMNKNFNGNTCVYEKGLTNKKLKFKKRPNLQSVHLEDTKFNSLYNVESTDQIEARYLLTTAFIERYLNIKTAFKAQYIRAEFKNNKLYLILGVNKDLFAMGNISKKTTAKTFVELFEEIYSVLSLVDVLKLNQNIGL